MNLQTLYAEFEKYFETTSKEQVLEDWNTAKKSYQGIGPNLNDFFNSLNLFSELSEINNRWKLDLINGDNYNPEISSDYFF